jgi:hypothetical protein
MDSKKQEEIVSAIEEITNGLPTTLASLKKSRSIESDLERAFENLRASLETIRMSVEELTDDAIEAVPDETEIKELEEREEQLIEAISQCLDGSDISLRSTLTAVRDKARDKPLYPRDVVSAALTARLPYAA